MSDEAFYKRLSELEITHEMADECAGRLIAGAFRRTDKKPRFTIPTRHDDDDVVIGEYIKRQKAVVAERDALRALLREARPFISTWAKPELVARIDAAMAKGGGK